MLSKAGQWALKKQCDTIFRNISVVKVEYVCMYITFIVFDLVLSCLVHVCRFNIKFTSFVDFITYVCMIQILIH